MSASTPSHTHVTTRPRGHRRRGFRTVAVAAAAALAAGLLPTTTAAAAADEPPLAAEELGIHPVGRTTVEVAVPHRDVPLPVEVWYPADRDAVVGEPLAAYTLRVPFGASTVTLTQPSPHAVDEPAAATGSFPLVVFSHGSGGLRFQSLSITEALASHGYVVVAPDHLGNTFADTLAPDPDARPVEDRPKDVSALIDAAEAGDISPLLEGIVDTERVAVAGHSFGGYTSLAAAGGNATVGYEPDGRVGAIVPIAPAARAELLPDAALTSIDIPTLLIGGTADDVTPIDPNVTRAQELIAADVVHRLDVADAGHYSFTNVCDFADAIRAQLGGGAEIVLGLVPGYPETCDGTLADAAGVLELTSRATVGFLDAHLRAVTGPEQPGEPGEPGEPREPGGPDPAPVGFPDVSRTNVHAPAIESLAADGLLLGSTDGLFRPAASVTRGQLASVLTRVLELTPTVPTPFSDTAGHAHEGAIGAVAQRGLLRGYDDGTFRPEEPVRRDHVAAVLGRWLAVSPETAHGFPDLAGNPHASAIAALTELGVLRGFPDGTYGPERLLRRDQFASLMHRTLRYLG